MAGGGHGTDGKLQGHGEDSQGPMRLETARIDEALGLEDRPCNTKSVSPVALLGLAQDPILAVQKVEIDNLDIQFFQEGEDAFLLHHFPVGAQASFAQADRLGPHFPEHFCQGRERVVVRGSGRGIRRIEIRFDQHVFSLHGIDSQRRERCPYAVLFDPRSSPSPQGFPCSPKQSHDPC